MRATRIPPQAIEAEQATLGAMLLERQAIQKAAALLAPEDFHREAHGIIFGAVVELARRGDPVDQTTLAAELSTRGKLEQANGQPYLSQLLDAVPTAAHVEYYARIVADKALLRRLIGAAAGIAEECYGDVESVADVASRAEAAIREVARAKGRLNVRTLREGLDAAYERIGKAQEDPAPVRGVPTGIGNLDGMTGGFAPGALVYVAGRPGLGKTSLMMTGALASARAGYPALLFSFEMSHEEIEERWVQMGCQVCSQRLRAGTLEETHWRRIADGMNRMRDLPVAWYAGRPLAPSEILVVARQVAGDMGIGLVLVDYLQLMSMGGRRRDGRTQEVDDISRALKGAAQELRVPIMVGCQLSREVERRTPPRPVLADLRESGQIEADANAVLLLYSQAYYDRQRSRAEGDQAPPDPDGMATDRTEIIVAKQRNGPTGVVQAGFQRNFTRFVNLERGGGR